MSIKPPCLRERDTIGVIAPGSPMKEERLQRGLEYLEKRGFRVVLGEHIRDQRGYLAGDDAARAEDFHRMVRDDHVRAIFCARGGYGTPRLLPWIDYDLVRRNPKILVGYSDITALQCALFRETGLVSFSGPMVAVEMGKGLDPFTEEFFWRMLMSREPLGPVHLPAGQQLKVLRDGVATGRLIPANISILSGLLGTPYLPELREAILFLEEITEEPYRVDRYLTQFRLAGLFEQVRGLVFGQFIDCVPKDPESPTLTVEEILQDLAGKVRVPVLASFPYGHGDGKLTLPMGIRVMLDTSGPEVVFEEGAVESEAATI